MDSIIEHRDWY